MNSWNWMYDEYVTIKTIIGSENNKACDYLDKYVSLSKHPS